MVLARSVLLLMAMLVASAGCVSSKTPATYSIPPEQLLPAFRQGNASLQKLTVVSGYSVASAELAGAQDTKILYDAGQWDELAVRVMRINSGSDIGWFYLARAAEETGFEEAAATYYRKSIQEASPKGVSGCIGRGCQGFNFPEESQRRLGLLSGTKP